MTRSDAIVRRQLLKAGLIAAGLPFCPEALFDRLAAADDEKPAADTPIGPREIIKGLDGMSRVAEKRNTFAGGHNAAAVISSAFFCREQGLDADTQKEMLAYLDARLLKNPIYAAPGRRRPPTRSSSRVCSKTSTPASPHCAGKATTSSSRSPASRPSARCPRPRRPSGSTGCGRWSGASGRRGAAREGFRPARWPRRRAEVRPLRFRGVPEGEGGRVRRARGDDRARPGRVAPHGARGTGPQGSPGLLAVGPGGTRG